MQPSLAVRSMWYSARTHHFITYLGGWPKAKIGLSPSLPAAQPPQRLRGALGLNHLVITCRKIHWIAAMSLERAIE